MRKPSVNGQTTGRRGGFLLAGLACVLLAAALAPLGCSDNPSTTFLLPPGGKGGIVGVLSFPGVEDPPFPVADVLAVQTDNPDCVSEFGGIAMLGTHNGFDVGRASEFLFEEVLPCLWVLELELEAGLLEFKFVTGNSPTSIAFDSPPDYGSIRPNDGADPLEGTADAGASGPDGNLSVTIPTAGTWTVVLNEATDPATYRITQEPLVIESDPADGTFEVLDIPAGSYDVSIEAEGYLPVVRRGVNVRATQVTDLGGITMEVASGVLSGTVAFADNPDPLPEATVEVLNAGSPAVVASATTSSAFSFTGLETGSYDVRVTSPGYLEEKLEGIQYVNGQNTDVGTITLEPGCESTHTIIQLAGDFNGFDLNRAPFMTQGPNCVWTDTLLALAPAVYNFKFVTDGAFDNPNDYGGDEDQTLEVPGTFPVQVVSGIGTAIRIEVPETGDYEFKLDEARLEFTVTKLGGAVVRRSIFGEVAFSGLTETPYPLAVVLLRQAGETTVLATDTTTATDRTFRFSPLQDGTYDLTFSAFCFIPQVRDDVVVNAQEVDLGVVTLPSAPSQFDRMQLALESEGYSLATAPDLVENPGCVWTVTKSFEVGAFRLKFATDGAFDNGPDYGSTSTVTLSVSADPAQPSFFNTTQVTGSAATGAFRLRFTQAGNYTFVLDERRQRLEVRRAP